jgi:hypothetical protein
MDDYILNHFSSYVREDEGQGLEQTLLTLDNRWVYRNRGHFFDKCISWKKKRDTENILTGK